VTRVGCRQLAPILGDLAANQRTIVATIAAATGSGTEILVLPELVTSGYMFQTADELAGCAVPAGDPLFAEWSAAIHGDAIVVGGFAERGPGGVFSNSAVLLDAGGVLATYRKAHLWDREKLFFEPGSQPAPVVGTRFGRVAVMICYDLEFPEYTRQAALAGADLIAAPTNWPLADRPAGERAPEVLIAQAAARVNHVPIAVCDRTGTERGQVWTAGTMIIDENGWPAAVAGTTHRADADLDLAHAQDKKITPNNDLFGDRRTDLY
jgi:predicted amidohydrolase